MPLAQPSTQRIVNTIPTGMASPKCFMRFDSCIHLHIVVVHLLSVANGDLGLVVEVANDYLGIAVFQFCVDALVDGMADGV